MPIFLCACTTIHTQRCEKRSLSTHCETHSLQTMGERLAATTRSDNVGPETAYNPKLVATGGSELPARRGRRRGALAQGRQQGGVPRSPAPGRLGGGGAGVGVWLMPGRASPSNGHRLCGGQGRTRDRPLATVLAQRSGSASQGVALSAFGGHLRIGSVMVPILTVSPLTSSPRRRDFHQGRIHAHLPGKIIFLFLFSVFRVWLEKSHVEKAILPCFSRVFNQNQVTRRFFVLQPADRAIGSLTGGSGAFRRGPGCEEALTVPAWRTWRLPTKLREAGGSS